jgi:NhaP-type Na+/H+ or K+/H+ antiporter
MLISIGLIFTLGLLFGELFRKWNLPGFLGMIIVGVALGPYALDLIDQSILSISTELRTIALAVILLRAGLSLDIKDLKQIGKPAFFMAFIPATLEILVVALLAPILFGIPLIEALLLGTVLSAVSPAVIVPKMIHLMEEGYGKEKRIPHLILASASVDDIYVIVLFTSFLQMYQTGDFSLLGIALLPLSILTGVVIGFIVGYLLAALFAVFRVRDTIKVLIILGAALILIALQEDINKWIPFSSLLSVMVMGISFLNQAEERALRLRNKYNKVWVFAELILFVLVGSAVDIRVAIGAGALALLLLLSELIGRFIGVQISLVKTSLNTKERLFCGISYIPKATVQAAIGSIPLMVGVPSGSLILAIAVLSILVTAPLGALGIDLTYKKWLTLKH